MSAKDYPEHLNPFDDNYVEASTSDGRQKYNTWSSTLDKSSALDKSSFLEKSRAALKSGKLVRRVSIIRSAVERFATKKKLLFHSSSFTKADLPQRSHSFHEDFSFRIISPKLKEKIRQRAFSQSRNKPIQHEADPHPDSPSSSQLPVNEWQSPSKSEIELSLKPDEPFPVSPTPERENPLEAKTKTRKKKPPPPPPVSFQDC